MLTNLSNFSIKSKLFMLAIAPLLLVQFLSFMILADLFEDKQNLQVAKRYVLESKAISEVVHFMQIERGISVRIVASSEKNTQDSALFLAKKNLNEAISNAKIIYQNSKNNKIASLLNELEQREKTIDLAKLSALSVKKYYTDYIYATLEVAKTIPSFIEDRENRNFMQSYIYLSLAKESLGQLRASLAEAFQKKELHNELFLNAIEHLKYYELNSDHFKTTATKEILFFYNTTFKGEAVEKTFNIIGNVTNIKNSPHLEVDPSFWFAKSTTAIDMLRSIESHLFKKADDSIEKKLSAISYKTFALISFFIFNILALVLFLVSMIRKVLSSTNMLEEEKSNTIMLLEQYKLAVDRSFIVSKTDSRGVITYTNDEFCAISGYSRDELLGKPHSLVRHPDMSKETFKEMWHTIKELKKPWFGEVKNLRRDGSFYWVKATVNPIIDKDGNVLEYIGIRTDITQQKLLAEHFKDELLASTKNLNFSMHLSKEYERAIDSGSILSKTDKDGTITYVNDKFLELSGFTLDELIGKNHRFLSSGETQKRIYDEMWETITKAKIWEGVLKNRTKSGGYFWTKTTIVPIKDINNEIIEYLAIRSDITKIMEQRREFERLAKTDPLTSYGNRFKLNHDIRELDNSSVALFNIDSFRQVNDFYGHQLGDLLIISIAKKIDSVLSGDKNLNLYRLQGDEFIVLAVGQSRDFMLRVVKNILDSIKESFSIQDEQMLISCSCGVSFEEKEQLISTANMALKIAKKSGVDFIIYDDSISLNHEYENNIIYTKKITHAIKNDNFVVYYQPIVNNLNQKYEKYECLVRMLDNDKVISPYFFLDIAKQTKQYFDITKAVVFQSFEMFVDKNVEFSLNLSISDITNKQITEYIISMLEKYNIGSKVVFEIVESESIQNFQVVMKFMEEIKRYGCKIAIDDFGTGYSNFEYLIKLKADYLKIDGSLIKNIDRDQISFLAVKTIVEFSKNLGMKTIAEFVEDETIFQIVRDLGIDYSQGYYFSAPKKELSTN